MESVMVRQENIDFFPVWKLIFICALVFAIGLSIHAVEKHGIEAELVRACLDAHGPIQQWKQPNGRIVSVCQLPDGRYGLSIDDKERGVNITAFIKNKMRYLFEVERYLINRGAELIWSR